MHMNINATLLGQGILLLMIVVGGAGLLAGPSQKRAPRPDRHPLRPALPVSALGSAGPAVAGFAPGQTHRPLIASHGTRAARRSCQ